MQRGDDSGVPARQVRLCLARLIGGCHPRRHGERGVHHRGRQQARAPFSRRLPNPHQQNQLFCGRRRPATHRERARTHRGGENHRTLLRRTHRRWCVPPDGHRLHPQRHPVVPWQPQRHRHPYRDVLRRYPAFGEERRHQRQVQEIGPW